MDVVIYFINRSLNFETASDPQRWSVTVSSIFVAWVLVLILVLFWGIVPNFLQGKGKNHSHALADRVKPEWWHCFLIVFTTWRQPRKDGRPS